VVAGVSSILPTVVNQRISEPAAFSSGDGTLESGAQRDLWTWFPQSGFFRDQGLPSPRTLCLQFGEFSPVNHPNFALPNVFRDDFVRTDYATPDVDRESGLGERSARRTVGCDAVLADTSQFGFSSNRRRFPRLFFLPICFLERRGHKSGELGRKEVLLRLIRYRFFRSALPLDVVSRVRCAPRGLMISALVIKERWRACGARSQRMTVFWVGDARSEQGMNVAPCGAAPWAPARDIGDDGDRFCSRGYRPLPGAEASERGRRVIIAVARNRCPSAMEPQDFAESVVGGSLSGRVYQYGARDRNMREVRHLARARGSVSVDSVHRKAVAAIARTSSRMKPWRSK